jgi:hypothetical protein
MTSLQANPVFLQSDNHVPERKRKGSDIWRGAEREDTGTKEKRAVKEKLKVHNIIIQMCFKPV